MTKSAPTTELSVRHFRNLFYGVSALFLATEAVALTGLVPHLRPVRFGELSANILFAIGFGCPLVLYLSSLPRLREILRSLGAAVALTVLLLGLWAVGQDN